MVVSTHLKNIRQIGSFPQEGVKITNLWNHHLGSIYHLAWKRHLCVFKLWCKECGQSPAIHSFQRVCWTTRTKERLLGRMWKDQTTLFFRNNSFSLSNLHSELNPDIRNWRALWLKPWKRQKRFWTFWKLDRVYAQQVQHYMIVLLAGFKVLASWSKSLKIPANALKPKLHAWPHKQLTWSSFSNKGPEVLNPLFRAGLASP